MIYFDSSYLVRLYYKDPGFERVRHLATGARVACGLHGRAEVVAALHRKLREGVIPHDFFRITLDQFRADCDAGAFRWLPLSPAVFDRIAQVYCRLPQTIFLRAADALHLACAAENRFREIHSNDERLLTAAPHFGLKGVNVL